MDRKVLRSQSLRLRARAIDVLEDRRDPKLYMGDNEYMKASQLLEMAAEQAACAKDEYCAKLRDPRAWGGGPEIVALSNALIAADPHLRARLGLGRRALRAQAFARRRRRQRAERAAVVRPMHCGVWNPKMEPALPADPRAFL